MTYEQGLDFTSRARQVAVRAHAGQMYGHDPYIVHPDDVVAILLEYGFRANWQLIAAGFLHDVPEDTSVTVEQIAEEFTPMTAFWVENVTGRGKNRKERNADIYRKAPTAEESVALKLADRISNQRHALNQKTEGKLQMYLKEYPAFRQALYRDEHASVKEMWSYLDRMYALLVK